MLRLRPILEIVKLACEGVADTVGERDEEGMLDIDVAAVAIKVETKMEMEEVGEAFDGSEMDEVADKVNNMDLDNVVVVEETTEERMEEVEEAAEVAVGGTLTFVPF